MRLTNYSQVSLWPWWSRWLASFTVAMSFASMALSQESGLASSARPHQQTASHPLRFFQSNKASETVSTVDNHKAVETTRQISLETLPIQRPTLNRQSGNHESADHSPSSPTQAMTTILSALAIVLGAFFLVIWLTRSANRRRWSPLPSEAVQLLGRAPLAGRQWMQLIRVGKKLVMVSVNGNQVDTITEITDPEEVEQLVALCHKNQSNQFRQTFQQVLDQHCQNNPREAASPALKHEHSYFTNTG